MSSRPARRAVPAVLLAVLLSGCGVFSGGDDAQSRPTLTPSPIRPSTSSAVSPRPSASQPGLARYYDQTLDWKPCREQFECAKLTVPLDYAKPGGRAIRVAVLRSPSTDKGKRIGSLLVNPGGPGVSGVDFAATAPATFGADLRQAFDIVGFDPRGVGESAPLACLSDRQLDRFVASDPDPDTTAETQESDRLVRDFGRGCVAHDPGLARHVSTEEAARDMDVLRAALGDERLSYFGFSYGTYLGATYAGLFPDRVGRMVLDGALDPSLSTVDLGLVQARGFETALRAYVQNCVDGGSCFLGDTVESGTRRIQRFLDQVDRRSLPGSESRRLTEGYAVLGIWQPLYYREEWDILSSALKAGFAGNGAPLMSLADFYTQRGPGGFRDNALEMLYAVNCLDHDDGVSSSKVGTLEPAFERASPTFGRTFAYSTSACANWPIHTGRQPAPVTAKGSAPIMVVGTTRDPATPIEGARGLVRQLDDAVLVTRDGDGHTAYHQGSQCVDDTIEAYLVAGKVPKSEVDCR
ncbi:MAG: alpha/beta fold hydrolase [Nocardioidaceae bacterium]|nr:alpha/beta fold hydrolase [Nocardioidaceae bacterium]NUS50666.1 alpha/beta fold hydrolase [Nocardioidaceae bacterium]